MLTKKAFTDKSSLFSSFFSQIFSNFFGSKKSKASIRPVTPLDYPPARQILGALLALGIIAIGAQAQSFTRPHQHRHARRNGEVQNGVIESDE